MCKLSLMLIVQFSLFHGGTPGSKRKSRSQTERCITYTPPHAPLHSLPCLLLPLTQPPPPLRNTLSPPYSPAPSHSPPFPLPPRQIQHTSLGWKAGAVDLCVDLCMDVYENDTDRRSIFERLIAKKIPKILHMWVYCSWI